MSLVNSLFSLSLDKDGWSPLPLRGKGYTEDTIKGSTIRAVFVLTKVLLDEFCFAFRFTSF